MTRRHWRERILTGDRTEGDQMALPVTTRTRAEQELREAMLTGRPVDWRTGNSAADDPAHGAGWDVQRTVDAAMLAELLTDTEGPRRPRALRLAGARIVGQLDLEMAELVCPLVLKGCWFAEPVVLREARAPALRLPGCHLPGLLALQLTTHVNLELNDGFTAHGEINLLGAHIGGQLDLSGAKLTNPNGPALTADGLSVDGSMFCREGFAAKGEVRVPSAHIGGQLNLKGAKLTNPNGPALTADRLSVDQDLVCREGFAASGEMRLAGAHIGGQLDLSGAKLTNPNGPALTADRLTVDQSMFCREGFAASGEMRLAGAHIGGQLDLSGATLFAPRALMADRLTVDESMFCREGFAATGAVSLIGAHIAGQLNFNKATRSDPDLFGLYLQELRAGTLHLRGLSMPPTFMDFTYAQVGALVDEPASWPSTAVLDGFVYDALYDDEEGRPVSAHQRLNWLTRDPGGYSPQPYEQLAAVYRRAGRDQDARTVAIAKQRARRRALDRNMRSWGTLSSAERRRRTLSWVEWLWSGLLDGLVGFGYRTWLAGLWLLGFWLVGWAVFDRAHAHHGLVLAKPGEAHPSYHGAVYALDTLLPVVDLRQQAVWIPHGGV